MSLSDIFRQKTVSILPGSSVTVDYLRTSLQDIIASLPKGEIVLVKQHIQPDDAETILKSNRPCIVVSSEPETIEEMDAQELLENGGIHVGIQGGITLDYLHCGSALFVFSDSIDVSSAQGQQSRIPNAVKIYPITRHDAEVVIAVDFDRIVQSRIDQAPQPTLSNSETNDDSEPAVDTKMTIEEARLQQKVALLRKKLKSAFDERFCKVDVSLTGISLESQTISLTNFYRRNKIAGQRLRGSWMLFSKEQAAEAMDVGIGQRALDVWRDEFTKSIEGYGRIIPKSQVSAYINAVEKIEEDMVAYLRGDPEIKTVGTIPVMKWFKPQSFLDDILVKLRQYLNSLSPGTEISAAKYKDNVEKMVWNASWQIRDCSSKVELRKSVSNFDELQWEDDHFLWKVEKLCSKHPDFFDEEFLSMLNRYMDASQELKNPKGPHLGHDHRF